MAATWHELWDRRDGLNGPVAASLPDCAALLGVPLLAVEAAAAHVEPYICGDGRTRKWSVAELRARLGLVDLDRRGRRRVTRTGDRLGEPRRHAARRGAAVTNGRRKAERAAQAGLVLDPPEPVEDLAAVEDLADLDAGEQ